MQYYTTTRVYLQCEDFHNFGISPETIRTIIEKIPNHRYFPYGLNCIRSGINNNWIIEIYTTNDEYIIQWIVETIEDYILRYINNNKNVKV